MKRALPLLLIALLVTSFAPDAFAKSKKGGSNTGGLKLPGMGGGGNNGKSKKGNSKKGNSKKGGSSKPKKEPVDIVKATANGTMVSTTSSSFVMKAKAPAKKAAKAPAKKNVKAPAKKEATKSDKTVNYTIAYHSKTTITLDGLSSSKSLLKAGMKLSVNYAMQKSTGKKIALSISALSTKASNSADK
ncbi:MAG: hypothetical protein HN909_05065 [Phycisphaerales bacterium]|jgi:hypothetical protein|nr:hypothetical protein [Phycisphaerales bacterium]MBT7171122.1 hypothetical protein [Phycisphaerales bacterium]